MFYEVDGSDGTLHVFRIKRERDAWDDDNARLRRDFDVRPASAGEAREYAEDGTVGLMFHGTDWPELPTWVWDAMSRRGVHWCERVPRRTLVSVLPAGGGPEDVIYVA